MLALLTNLCCASLTHRILESVVWTIIPFVVLRFRCKTLGGEPNRISPIFMSKQNDSYIDGLYVAFGHQKWVKIIVMFCFILFYFLREEYVMFYFILFYTFYF